MLEHIINDKILKYNRGKGNGVSCMRAKQGVKSEAIFRSKKFLCIADLTPLHVVIKASHVANTSLR
jgi:hypothetical protein